MEGRVKPPFKNLVLLYKCKNLQREVYLIINTLYLCLMLTSLPNGKVVDLPVEIIFLSDHDYNLYIQALVASNTGDDIEDCFKDSSLEKVKQQVQDDMEDGFLDDDVLLSRDDI